MVVVLVLAVGDLSVVLLMLVLPPRPPWLAVELDHLCGVYNLNLAEGELSYYVVCKW